MGKLTFQAALGGTVDLVGPNTASAVTLNLPAVSGDIVGTGSTSVITTGMISGQIAVAQGGTNSSTAQGAINTLAGAVTSGSYLRGNGTNVTMSAIQAADVPTLNQNTTGTAANITASSNSSLTTLSSLSLPGSQVSGNISGNAANVTGIVAVANGGTGTTTPALVAGTNVTITGTWPNQTINSTGGGSGMVYPAAGIPISTGSAWGSSYSTTGSGSVIALAQSPTFTTPILGTPQSGNFSTGIFTWPTFNQNTTGTAANITATTNSTITTLSVLSLPATQISGTVGINNGGTGQTTASAAFNALSPIVTTGDLIVGNGANSATRLGCGLNGYFLASNGSTPTWTSTLGIGNGGTGLTTTPANGALDIGNGTGFTRTTLTAGSGISITNGSGSITIASSVTAVTSVTGTSPVVSSGGTTPAISLATAYGDTLNPYASKTANYVLAAPNGTAGVPTFRAIVSADIPTLNQNTTGTAANITATSNSTLTTLSSLSLPGSQVSGNISGNAANVTGTVAIGNGGTGQTTASAAFNALSPITTAGDLILGNGVNSATRLGIGANGYVLTSNGTTASWAAATGGVSQIVAGTNVTISPTGGTGVVTINATGGASAYTRTSFTATSGQTAFTVTYAVGYLQVYLNGVLLAASDYTATSGTGFTLAVGANTGDIVEALVITTAITGITTGKSIAMAMIFGY